ncbi:MAG: hypothetical protein ACM35F_02555 [Betaproteobacteria bacterium]|jgi:hypothetical protein
MTDTRFCYCCRIHHPQDQVRLYRTRQGLRWRCLRSIEAAGRSVDERNRTGHEQTAANREASRRQAEFSLSLRTMFAAKVRHS